MKNDGFDCIIISMAIGTILLAGSVLLFLAWVIIKVMEYLDIVQVGFV